MECSPRLRVLPSVGDLKTILPRFTFAGRVLLLSAFVIGIGFAWLDGRAEGFSVAWLSQYCREHPISAIALFLAVYALSVVACLPTLPMNLGAGYLWGGLGGGVLSAASVTAGGLVAFAATRYIAAGRWDPVAQGGAFAAVLSELRSGGWRMVAFLRVNPVVPTGPLNYLLGLTQIRAGTFAWSTFVFLLPPSMAVAFLGDMVQTFSSSDANVSRELQGMLAVSAATFALAISSFAGQMVRKMREKK